MIVFLFIYPNFAGKDRNFIGIIQILEQISAHLSSGAQGGGVKLLLIKLYCVRSADRVCYVCCVMTIFALINIHNLKHPFIK